MVDLGDDLDVVTVISAKASSGPRQAPGICTREVPGGTSSRRAIQGVVISAATVIGITCTVQSNPARGASRSRACRSECSASRPVTKWMRGRSADKDELAGRRCREFIMRARVSRRLQPTQARP